jgi:DNA-binding MarR family transcriptional regulator
MAAGAPKRAESSGSAAVEPAEQLRAAVQRFVRGFGLLASDRTPCGTPLSTSHAHALMVLLEHGRRAEPCSQQRLGEALGIDKSNVARLCARLERDGHGSQRRPEHDGRARLVSLTPAGRRLAERVEARSRARFGELLAALPSAEARASVLASLDALNGAIALTSASEPSQ